MWVCVFAFLVLFVVLVSSFLLSHAVLRPCCLSFVGSSGPGCPGPWHGLACFYAFVVLFLSRASLAAAFLGSGPRCPRPSRCAVGYTLPFAWLSLRFFFPVPPSPPALWSHLLLFCSFVRCGAFVWCCAVLCGLLRSALRLTSLCRRACAAAFSAARCHGALSCALRVGPLCPPPPCRQQPLPLCGLLSRVVF